MPGEVTRVRRVLHVEDSASMRAWLELVVDGVEDLRVVGGAADGRRGLALAAELQPDLIVLDQSMPVLDGLEALPLLREACPGARIVLWSNDPGIRAQALALGADDVVDKAEPIETLVGALRA